jgi:hypothetical protein
MLRLKTGNTAIAGTTAPAVGVSTGNVRWLCTSDMNRTSAFDVPDCLLIQVLQCGFVQCSFFAVMFFHKCVPVIP